LHYNRIILIFTYRPQQVIKLLIFFKTKSKSNNMALQGCCNMNFTQFEQSKFTGCDGKEWDDDFLKFHINMAVKEERYEWANECKIELERRKSLNKTKK